WTALTWSTAAVGQAGTGSSAAADAGGGATVAAGGGVTVAAGGGGGGGAGLGDSAATICLNSSWPSFSARSRSAPLITRCSASPRACALRASGVSPPLLASSSNSLAIANQAKAAAGSLSTAPPCSYMSPSVNIDAVKPRRAAARSNSTALGPSCGAPLPSRSIRARLCSATGTSPATALRYQSTALVESRSTVSPRSYSTPMVNAAVGEPASAARRYQPAPDGASRGTPAPARSRRPSSSIAGSSPR